MNATNTKIVLTGNLAKVEVMGVETVRIGITKEDRLRMAGIRAIVVQVLTADFNVFMIMKEILLGTLNIGVHMTISLHIMMMDIILPKIKTKVFGV